MNNVPNTSNSVTWTGRGMKRAPKGSLVVRFNNRTGCKVVCKKKKANNNTQ